MRSFVLAACLLFSAGVANAADSHGGFATYGAGATSCGEHTRFVRAHSDHEQADVTWVLGFLTAYNLYGWKGDDVASHTDGDAVQQWLGNYCASHPLDYVSDAAQQLIAEFRRRSHAAR
jgi:hypothetical protein